MTPEKTQAKTQAVKFLCDEFRKNNKINPEKYENVNVKLGLRNSDGTGVMAGLTLICNVHGYIMDEAERIPVEGELIYRGINIKDIIKGCQAEDRFGYEEVAWLLLFGKLPTKEQLASFGKILEEWGELPEDFTEDMIMKAPSPNIMNKLARSVLALYSYDDNADELSLENVMRQCIELIARVPTIMVNAYQVKRRYYDHQSMFFHPTIPGHSFAEGILSVLRPDRVFTKEEARILDLCLMLHAEHGGGNNSTFACRTLTSSGTDTYSAIAAGIGALKGHRHGGANIKVMEMLDYIKREADGFSDDQMCDYLRKLFHKEAGDHTGLVYGMGHAVYTKSDPRAQILRENAGILAKQKGFEEDFAILEAVERLTPVVFSEIKGETKTVCANVDLYSGLVYRMLGIPNELYTPLFAVSRMAGWSAHRIEELTNCSRIIRPAYKAVSRPAPYIPLDQR